MKSTKKIPFDFIFDYLYPFEYRIKPMFGCFALYGGNKILMIVRNQKDHPEDNGVWLATSKEYHQSLRNLFPSLRYIGVLGKGPTNWMVVPVENPHFEEDAIKICELIKNGDPRIGKVPDAKRKKN